MPVTKSAKRAQRVAARRREENLKTKALYKSALKTARRAIELGAAELGEMLSKASSALDTAAKSKGIHKNKAARLKSRLAKKAASTGMSTTPTKKAAPKKAAAKKPAAKKKTAKK